MKTHLFALCSRAASFTIAGALTLTVLATAPPSAKAGGLLTGTPLREGVGMTGEPDTHARALQRTLRERGYDLGAAGIDGRFGPLTALAVRRFQAWAGLAVDGIVGARTRRALARRSSTATLRQGVGMDRRPSTRVRDLQRTLERIGFDLGPSGADGRFGPLTAAAVRRLQRRHGLATDAIVGPRTRRMIALLAGRRSGGQRSGGQQTARDRNRRAATADQASQPRSRPQGTPTSSARASTTQEAATRATVIAVIALLMACAALATSFLRRRRANSVPHLATSGRGSQLDGHPAHAYAAASNGDRPDPGVTGTSDARHPEGRLAPDAGRHPPVPGRNGGRPLGPGDTVVGYVTVGAHASASQESLAAIDSICRKAGWVLRTVIRDEEIADLRARPGLSHALEWIRTGQARGLVICDIRRLTPSLSDLATLLEWFRDADARLIVPELSLDTGTPQGAETASTLIRLARGRPDRGGVWPGSHRGTAPRTDRTWRPA